MKTKNIFIAIVCLILCVACENPDKRIGKTPKGLLDNYRPMVVEGYQWNVVEDHADIPGQEVVMTKIYEIRGETIENDMTYKQIWVSTKEDKSDAKVCALVREDVRNQKVYLYREGQERLIYDFRLSVGDKVEMYIGQEDDYYLQLTHIYNRQDQENNSYRELTFDIYTKWNGKYEPFGTHIIWERYGSPEGLIPNNVFGIDGGANYHILCAYDEKGTIVLTNDWRDIEYAGYCFYTTTNGVH